jgi:hypothetical protein
MKRLPVATALLALALPTSALAASASRGTVLAVDRAHHLVRVVDARHRVHDYTYPGSLAGVRPGSALSFVTRGSRITRLRRLRAASGTVSFYARVVHSSKGGLVLVLPDGHKLSFSGHQLRHRRHGALGARDAALGRRRHQFAVAHMAAANPLPVTVNIQGLEPGVTVLVTETVYSSGAVTVTVTLPPPSVASGQQFSGVVLDVSQDAFMLQTADGSLLRLHMAASALAGQNLSVCDTVNVSFHQDNDLLVVDTVQVTGSSSSGDCSSGTDGPTDVIGTITAVSGSAFSVSSDQGQMSFTVDDPSVTDGFQVGDVVDVTYRQAADGSLDATDVEYSEQDVVGTVTAVSGSALTLTDAGGQTRVFTADPTQGVFDGVSVGDQVDIAYHMSGSQQVADAVDDQSTDGGSNGGPS